MTASAFSNYPSNGLIRRVASSDCGQLKPPSPSRRAWKVTNDFLEGPRNASDIFRVPSWNNAEKQSRNESSLRFSEGGERQPVVVPQDRLDHAVFRRAADSISMHSPIGTRMEQSAMENSSIPSIRPSLSCPTTLFESPLFRNHNILASPDGRMDGIRSGENSPGEADDFELNCNNVSGIEYDEEPSFQIDENANLPMRNLNDQFELFVDSTEDMGNIEFEAAESSVKLSTQRNVSKVDFDDSEHKSESKRSDHSTKPSPTSVLEIESKTSPAITTTRLENGVEVASIEMPSFHLHESLKGEMCQGLIDRVSFYSIVRNINKEALDAAMSDPRGHEFNDGSVHGRKGTISNGGNAVVAEDGKVHVHPNPDAESRSVLVAACLAECSSEHSDMFQKPPPLGAALLDEEWWLLGAIAARPPEEVAANQAAELPHTFAEAMGEKDDSSDRNAASSSRTQLWKPGRSWWEAKSGKNPWVEPVVHNNRWRYVSVILLNLYDILNVFTHN